MPGLEVWDEDAQDWYSVPPVEGAYVVNMGNLFARWTNDEYGSSVHVSACHPEDLRILAENSCPESCA